MKLNNLKYINLLQMVKNNHILFLSLIIIGFVIVKIPYLNHPFYWDAAWVYAPAVQYLAEQGPSLLPTSLPVDLGRGHPLLFHFLGSIWVKIFGQSLISLHSFPLFISCLLILSVYLFVKRFTNVIIGLSCALVFCLLRVFFVQSVFVLPEILFALFGLLTIWGFIDRKPWVLAISATLMILTKESGIAIVGILLLLELAFLIKDRDQIYSHLKIIGILMISIVPFTLFLWLQYNAYGWVFYPEHTSYLDLDFKNILVRINQLGPTIFSDYGLQMINVISLIFLLIWVLQREYRIWLKLVVILDIVLFILLFMERDMFGGADAIRILLGLFFLLTIVLFFSHKKLAENSKIHRLYWTSIAVIFGFVIFTSMNFFSYRYLIVIFPLMISIPLISFQQLHVPKKYLIIPLLLFVTHIAPHLSSSGQFADTDPSYINMVKAYERMTSYMTNHVSQNTAIQASFLPMICLSESRAGYLTDAQEYDNFVWNGNHKYLISVNGEFSEIENSENHRLTKEINLEEARIKIYKRIK